MGPRFESERRLKLTLDYSGNIGHTQCMAYPAPVKQKAIHLRQKGLSLNEISHQLSISKSTASLWVRNIELSEKVKNILANKKKRADFKPGNIHWQKADRSKNSIKWTPEKVKKIKKLYHSGLSMRQVGEKMDASAWAICSVMKRKNIKRRPAYKTQKIQFYNSPLSFKPKLNLTKKEQQLKTAGLMLYWAEGSKQVKDKVDFANSDPLMIKLFIKFLRTIYQVNEARIHCLIYCYPSHNISYLTKYWSSLVKVAPKQFYRPYIRKDGKNTKDKMKHGLLHINYNDKRLLNLILKEIKYLGYNI